MVLLRKAKEFALNTTIGFIDSVKHGAQDERDVCAIVLSTEGQHFVVEQLTKTVAEVATGVGFNRVAKTAMVFNQAFNAVRFSTYVVTGIAYTVKKYNDGQALKDKHTKFIALTQPTETSAEQVEV